MKPNAFAKLLEIKYPIIQAGMVWVSGAKLAAACANAGILGVIGAGSMAPPLLREQITKAFKLLNNNCPGKIAVNLPLLYKDIEQQINISLELGIKIFITSAGSPSKYTTFLKQHNCTVIHVTSTPALAKKCEDNGVDAVIAEGFEAGGHNGRDEITTMALIPQVAQSVSIPVIAAGGIATGAGIASAFALGASGVQIGTRFVCAKESSAHQNFKNSIIESSASDTKLVMKSLIPVRLLRNSFSQKVIELENKNSTNEELQSFLGKGRAKKGMLLGDLVEGELEAGQISGLIQESQPAAIIVDELIKDYNLTIAQLEGL